MRIVFFGSGEFGVPTLAALSKSHAIVGVVTQPDKPAGRGGEVTPTPIGAWAAANLPGVPLMKVASCNDEATAECIKALGDTATAWVVIAFGQKLGASLLRDRFAVNLHGSILPRWRGAAPINWAILEGDAEIGNSVITLADRMDAGLVLAQSSRAIDARTTAGDAHDALAADGPALVERVLSEHAAGSLKPVPQDEASVTTAPKLSKSDGWVDFTRAPEACRRRINGLSPWPGVTVKFREDTLKLLRAEVISDRAPEGAESGPPAGTILDADAGFVLCGNGGVLRLLEVQAAGKKAMSWKDFANGARVKSEEILVGGKPLC